MLYPNSCYNEVSYKETALHCILLLNFCLNEIKFACNLLLSGIMLIIFLSDAIIYLRNKETQQTKI